MRKYNLAYRYREFAEMSVSASLPETPISVGHDVTCGPKTVIASPNSV